MEASPRNKEETGPAEGGKERRVLFLDVDGVLILFNRRGEWNEECLLQLRRVLTETQAEVVLSSNWKRTEESINKLLTQFRRLSFPGFESESVQLPVTPELEYDRDVAYSRAKEIQEWLRIEAQKEEEKGRIVGWVAVDDMDLRRGHETVMQAHFVLTGREVGLIREKADEAIRLLLSDL